METGGFDDRQRSVRPRSVRTEKAVKALRERIRRNPLRKQKVLSREMDISPRSIPRLIKDDLGLGAFQRSTGHLLTATLKKIGRKKQKSC